jgi:SPP1 gp7 family putative phage head morphogenesis protein
VNLASSRIAAKVGIQQAKTLVMADAIADKIDAKIMRLWNQLLRLLALKVPKPDTQFKIAALLRQVTETALTGIDDGLGEIARQGHAQAIADAVATAPQSGLSLALQKANPERPVFTEARLSPEQRAQVEAQLFDPLTTSQVDKIVYAPSAGTSWNARLAAQTRLAPPDQLAALVTMGMAQGQTVQQLANTLGPAVQGVRASARRVARTEGMRVSHAARLTAFDELGDMVVGFQIHATMDFRVRPAHAARNGQIYYKKPKDGQLSITEMPNPPMEADGTVAFNCRCYLSPVLTVAEHIENDPAAKALFTGNDKKLIPDPVTYSEWFDTATEQERKWAVGTRRLAAVKKIKGAAPLAWADFLNPDTGQLLPVDALKGETAAQRQGRIDQVDEVIQQRRDLSVQVGRFGYVPPEARPDTPPVITPPPPPVPPTPPAPPPTATLPPKPGEPPHYPRAAAPTTGMDQLRQTAELLRAAQEKRTGSRQAVHPASGQFSLNRLHHIEPQDKHHFRYYGAALFNREKPLVNTSNRLQTFKGILFYEQAYGSDKFTQITAAEILAANNQQESEQAAKNIQKPLKDTEAFKKAQARANKALKVKPATLLSRLEKIYGKARMAKLVEITAKDLKELEKEKSIATSEIPDWFDEKRRRSAKRENAERLERYDEAHHTLAALTATMEQLEEDADNAQPIPKWVAVQFPEIAKKSITKLAEPMQVKLDGVKSMVESIIEKAPEMKRQAIERRIGSELNEQAIARVKTAGLYEELIEKFQTIQKNELKKKPEIIDQVHNAMQKGGPKDQSVVAVQLMTQTEEGSKKLYPPQFMQNQRQTLNFLNLIGEVPVNDCMVANRADMVHPYKSKGEDRAFALDRNTANKYPKLFHDRPRVFLANDDNAGVHVHEMGHILEAEDPYVEQMVQTFLNYRVGEEKPVSLKSVFPNFNYGSDEKGRIDNFDRYFDKNSAYYAGKEYGTGSEILSMGLQALFNDPVNFIEKDPEYAQFVLSVMQYKESAKARGQQ